MTSGRVAYGTKFYWNSYEVGELTNAGGVEMTADMVDMTSHESTDGFSEHKPSILHGGEISIEGNFLSSDTNGQMAMKSDFLSKTSRTAEIEDSDDTWDWQATCYIKSLTISSDSMDEKQKFAATLQITGKPTLTVS